MLDHIGFPVSDYLRSRAFYLKSLEPLGYGLVMEIGPEQTGAGSHAGFGPPGKPNFWIGDSGTTFSGRLHVAFVAMDRAAVAAFHAAALRAGGVDNGGPGLRPEYHATYFGAYVLDPDGHNIEAVCHLPE